MTKTDNQLDSILLVLKKIRQETYPASPKEIGERVLIHIDELTCSRILTKIKEDGYAEITYGKVGNVEQLNSKYYSITYQGLQFLERGGYQGEGRRLIRNNIWSICKIIAAVGNAVIIIGISVWAIAFNKDSSSNSNEIKGINDKIQRIELNNKSFQHEIDSLKKICL